jgi:hypothetical protein
MLRLNHLLDTHPELEIENDEFSVWNYIINSIKLKHQPQLRLAVSTGNNINYTIPCVNENDYNITDSNEDIDIVDKNEIKTFVSNYNYKNNNIDSDYDTNPEQNYATRSNPSSDYIYKENFFTRPIRKDVNLRETFEQNFRKVWRTVDKDKRIYAIPKSEVAILMSYYDEISSSKKYQGYYMEILDNYYLTQTGIKYVNSLITGNLVNNIKERCLVFTDYSCENTA